MNSRMLTRKVLKLNAISHTRKLTTTNNERKKTLQNCDSPTGKLSSDFMLGSSAAIYPRSYKNRSASTFHRTLSPRDRHFIGAVPCLNCWRNSHSTSCTSSPSYTSVRHNSSWVAAKFDDYSFSVQYLFRWIGDTSFVGYAENVFQFTHDVTGLPWWAVIIGTSVCVRLLVMLPIRVSAARSAARYEAVRPELENEGKKIRQEVTLLAREKLWPPATQKKEFYLRMNKFRKTVVKREKCHPAKTLILGWANLPVWIAFSISLRNMGSHPHLDSLDMFTRWMELKSDGFLWLSDLTVADPTYILPAVVAIFGLTTIQISALEARVKESLSPVKYPVNVVIASRVLTNLGRAVTVVLALVCTQIPTCVSLYWTTNLVYSLGESVLLLHPPCRRALGIPLVPTEPSQPFKQMLEELKKPKKKR